MDSEQLQSIVWIKSPDYEGYLLKRGKYGRGKYGLDVCDSVFTHMHTI